ncbi:isochorismate synthase [Vreelandella boliviensis]|uniref:Isochorismate synthase MenF n=1 Tax=Vreelandella boliviensis LC1 TaxID=1072583 RepID=A0A265E1X2_9GAMM|nr:isochorismate synthase [Halomonas boliviensis]EHJ94720.1 Menaquinone-specific isochorismate synthase [Halomonas boliviensis LC1]OZT75446.1 isochorismate synthase [Halomonas boliviensis LC1]
MQSTHPIEALKHQLDTLCETASKGFIRLSTPCQVESLMGWLNVQSVYPRLYWRARDAGAIEYAALGVVKAFDSLGGLQADLAALADIGGEQPDYFGGMAFDPVTPGWQHFPGCHFLLPRIELRRHQTGATLSLNLRFDDRCPEAEIAQARACLAALEEEQPLPCLLPHVYQREDRPSQKEWAASVAQVTNPDHLGHTPKVVLSRETCLTTRETPNPWALLARWQVGATDCFHFGIQLTPHEAFIGCPPERLYKREGRHLMTEALAGTTHRVRDAQQDQALADELLADKKNSLENQCVYQQLLTQLEPHSSQVNMGEAHIVKLRSVQHIRRLIHAELHSDVTDQQLLSVLPPTPAVGGVPRESALAFIRQHERHRRGWYAGVFGSISHANSDLSVAIRCAHVGPEAIRLYAGAGIVAGSQPDEEWRELDTKIADIMSLLGMG